MNLSYSELLNMPQWKEKRKEILARDGFCCRNCKSTTGLQVHHRQYHVIGNTKSFYKPWEYPSRYLITLCEDCHKSGHKKYNVPVFNRKPVLI